MSKKIVTTMVLSLLLVGLITTPAFAVSRSGWSDGAKIAFMWGFHYLGSHTSESDLVEDTIQVVGRLLITGSQVDSCSDSHPGSTAACNTGYDLLNPFNSATAASSHYFHKSGYVDSNFNTAKNF